MLVNRPPISAKAPAWLRLLRPHHWTKNLLLFAPALTSSLILEPDTLATALLSFLAFCCAASTGYVINDLADRDNDRDHPRKRYRPIASGEITVVAAGAIGLTCLALATAIALALNSKFSLLALLYVFLTTTYSLFRLKNWCFDSMLDRFWICKYKNDLKITKINIWHFPKDCPNSQNICRYLFK